MSWFGDLLFTPSVTAVQQRMGSRAAYARSAGDGPVALGLDEREFIGARDSFYLASVGEGGWPYVQHRGGPPGFVHVLDDRALGFADYRGNGQYISVGNLAADDRVALLFMDYPNRARLKVLARASIISGDQDAELVRRVGAGSGSARVERVFVLRVDAFDWNCPQHITPRFTEHELREALTPLRERLEALERENEALRGQLATRDAG
jgi:predicted pyridoxine 5'-phosphate oxidase superfamily flavin-nucleotide-binding protein